MNLKRYSLIMLILGMALSVSVGHAQGPVTDFQEFQPIPTNGALDSEFFTIGSDHYLAVANHYNGSTHNTDSKLYRWDGAGFVEFQAFPTNWAYDCEFFTINFNQCYSRRITVFQKIICRIREESFRVFTVFNQRVVFKSF